jgi:hypothetical protein
MPAAFSAIIATGALLLPVTGVLMTNSWKMRSYAALRATTPRSITKISSSNSRA